MYYTRSTPLAKGTSDLDQVANRLIEPTQLADKGGLGKAYSVNENIPIIDNTLYI